MKKQKLKKWIASVVMSSFFLFLVYLDKHHYLVANFWINSLIIGYVIGGIFIFHLIIRKIYWFKPYFVNKYNFLSFKVRYKKEFDFPKEILFDKIIEVIPKAGFKIRKSDKIAGNIFATSSIGWSSWGENIYIVLIEHNDKTTIDFCSACLFQFYDWGKNESNYEKFMKEFENSLIV